ncbi:MAG: hypothetical protein WC829_02770 [Hyphomicrobium sp.]|jgi:hypothetical protein
MSPADLELIARSENASREHGLFVLGAITAERYDAWIRANLLPHPKDADYWLRSNRMAQS